LSGFVVSVDKKIVGPWPEEFSRCSLEELAALRNDNRVWYRELRADISLVMDRKLAKQMSPELYAVDRTRYIEDMAECRRRTAMLGKEIAKRRFQVHA
jgi:hypothetical protein